MEEPLKYVSTFVSALSFMMALVLLISIIERTTRLKRLNTLVLGGLFSLAVLYTMSDPIVMPGRGQYDMRFVLIGAASALLGPKVGLIALATGLSYRFGIGGAGTAIGMVGMTFSFTGGLVWRMFIMNRSWAFWQKSLTLGLLIASNFFAIFMAPMADWTNLITSLGPYMFITAILGAFVLNYLISGELSFLSEAETSRIEATTDPLTGLLNRRGLNLAYPRYASSKRAKDKGISVVCLDVDRFKYVNDAHGHAVGDSLLCQMTGVVAAHLRPDDIFARLGGDEFAIVLRSVSAGEAKLIAERCRRLVQDEQFEFSGQIVDVSISVGAIWSMDHIGLDHLIEQADTALFAAKEGGRNRMVFSSKALLSRIMNPMPDAQAI